MVIRLATVNGERGWENIAFLFIAANRGTKKPRPSLLTVSDFEFKEAIKRTAAYKIQMEAERARGIPELEAQNQVIGLELLTFRDRVISLRSNFRWFDEFSFERDFTPAELEVLSNSDDPEAISAVAKNKNTPIQILARLLENSPSLQLETQIYDNLAMKLRPDYHTQTKYPAIISPESLGLALRIINPLYLDDRRFRKLIRKTKTYKAQLEAELRLGYSKREAEARITKGIYRIKDMARAGRFTLIEDIEEMTPLILQVLSYSPLPCLSILVATHENTSLETLSMLEHSKDQTTRRYATANANMKRNPGIAIQYPVRLGSDTGLFNPFLDQYLPVPFRRDLNKIQKE